MKKLDKVLYSIAALVDLGEETASSAEFKKKMRTVLHVTMGTFLAHGGSLFAFDKVHQKLAPIANRGFKGLRAMKANTEALAVFRNKPFKAGGAARPGGTLQARLEEGGAELFMPLFAREGLVGLIALSGKFTGEPYTKEDFELLKVIASQIAITLQNHTLFASLSEKLDENKKLYEEMRVIYNDTIQAFAAAIDAKDVYTKNHSSRVAKYVVAIAKELGWNEMDTEGIYIAGLLHDVGKIVISDEILKKQTAFTPEEIVEIKRHPALSYNILSKIKFPWKDVVDTIRHHHERLDGKGYPDAITSSSLSVGAKILTLADSFDAMTQDRPYRKKLDLHVAIDELRRCLGTQFDNTIMDAFCAVLEKEIKGHLPEPDILPHLAQDFDPSVITTMLEAIREELSGGRTAHA
jgi:putative nucleotidyltransferase with HDIG domain